jgi:hypothetical protein
MSQLMTFMREHPVVPIILLAVAIVTVLFSVLAFLMIRAGVSLKPLAFVGIYLAIVGGPQVAFHLSQSFGWIPERDLTWVPASQRAPVSEYAENEAALATSGGLFTDPEAVFGPGIDTDLLSDMLRLGPDGPFGRAEVAQMAIIPPGATSVVARYADQAAARAAAERYLLTAFGTLPPAGTDGAVTATRPVGDVAKVLVAGRTLVVMTGPDESDVAARLRASRILAPATAAVAPSPGDDYWLYRPVVLVSLLLLLVCLAVVWFFKGSAWAAMIPARADTMPASADELRQRLLAINELDAPFVVEEEPGSGRLVVTWRFADAKWVDLARARGMRRTHRILLEVDENRHVVRPTEQQSSIDWSAGRGGASFQWRTTMGIVFLQLEHQRVFGLQLDERGRFVPQLSYAYTFNLQEMKAPFITAVTEAGWNWRPTAWHGPAWLRWLTN